MLVGVSALITPGVPTCGLLPCSSRTLDRVFAAAISFHAASENTRMFTVLNQPPPCSLRMWLCDTGSADAGPPTRDRSIIAGWLRHGVPARQAAVPAGGTIPAAAIA